MTSQEEASYSKGDNSRGRKVGLQGRGQVGACIGRSAACPHVSVQATQETVIDHWQVRLVWVL